MLMQFFFRSLYASQYVKCIYMSNPDCIFSCFTKQLTVLQKGMAS